MTNQNPTPPIPIFPTPEQLMPDLSTTKVYSPEQEQLFEQIAQAADYHFCEMTRYESYLKPYRDLKNIIATARMDGWKRGLEESRQKGEAGTTTEIAIRALLEEFPLDFISEVTGLSKIEIENLRKQFFVQK
ncbi:MAG: hypothetical protein SF097_18035 [Acidobacteriota bacterium]|nr:hypothetical protein [Acidobacteriota bacterium]